MKQIDGGVTAAKGFQAASAAAGIKYKDRKDMAMILQRSALQGGWNLYHQHRKGSPL